MSESAGRGEERREKEGEQGAEGGGEIERWACMLILSFC